MCTSPKIQGESGIEQSGNFARSHCGRRSRHLYSVFATRSDNRVQEAPLNRVEETKLGRRVTVSFIIPKQNIEIKEKLAHSGDECALAFLPLVETDVTRPLPPSLKVADGPVENVGASFASEWRYSSRKNRNMQLIHPH
jgi:hypothetical protein